MPSPRANPTLIGAFVLGAVALAVAAALLLGSDRLFRQTERWVVYFDSSVMGLDVGAPVVFRGVQIGSVVEVDAYIDPVRNIFATPVFLEIVEGSVQMAPDTPHDLDESAVMRTWIREKGLRAQLQTQSMVTGKLYVELGFHEDAAPPELKGLHPDLLEIPAIPTQLEQIGHTIERIVNRLWSLPLEEIVENLNATLASAKDLLGSEELASAVANLDDTLAEMRGLIAKMNDGYGRLDANIEATLVQTRNTLAAAESAIGDVQALVEPGSPVHYELVNTLEEITLMARSLRALSDSIARDPNQIIFGRQSSGGRQ